MGTERVRDLAIEAATRAGHLLRAEWGKRHRVTFKGSPTNLVTEMDRRAEAVIIEAIQAAFPTHSILSEERGRVGPASSSRWIIDPLDGTTNYSHGFPAYAVSIALEVDGEVVLGVVYDPNLEECFVAQRGQGTFLNGERLHVSETQTLDESLLATGFPYNIREANDNNLSEYAAFSLRCQGVRRTGSAVLYLSYVAAGRLDGYWELRVGPWDVAAGALMVEEAGGRVTDLAGTRLDLANPRIVASNTLIHEEMLAVLKEVNAQ
ncbi:MAG: inositol monophosphatase family protein [Candidatus Methylomirabilia bacterium]